ncbi:glycosyl transferase family 2 [Hymenobacter roseosalivarius DSM 11622]|uniref:Glycosyl transferase family 2 n=1 Tax=Hymenobacter roseosalivarius DSM 11622 TaxID=645990 RepID=A0A1W1V2B9_9BACT|nr:glycosyltransferase [Hymenobacter roseosalivarius]SMB87499.1 glycosyl transferase family 2 [Hymenobacter roseosalivarius DSM 11622]
MEYSSPALFHAAQEATAAPPLIRLVAVPPAAELLISVIIPAKDEAENLPFALAALAAQTDLQGRPLSACSYEVIVLANNCHDQTAAVARAFARLHPQLILHVATVMLPPAEAHVGGARRLLMDEACQRLEAVGQPMGLIASTDADTQVGTTWLAAIMAEAAAGVEAVGGRILTTSSVSSGSPVRRYHLRDAAYQLLRAQLEDLLDPDAADPWPRHHQHFGASLALTARAYRRVGGLPAVSFLEDEALVRALRRHDISVRHSPQVRVLTSDRQQGRVAVGLSWQLRLWATMGEEQQEPLVESGPCLVALWQARQTLRTHWQASRTSLPAAIGNHGFSNELAATLHVPVVGLIKAFYRLSTFGELWEWVQTQQHKTTRWVRHWPLVPLSQARAELRQLVRQLGG